MSESPLASRNAAITTMRSLVAGTDSTVAEECASVSVLLRKWSVVWALISFIGGGELRCLESA